MFLHKSDLYTDSIQYIVSFSEHNTMLLSMVLDSDYSFLSEDEDDTLSHN